MVEEALEKNKVKAELWAVKYGYETTTNINEISTGKNFYEVNLNNLYIGDQKVKTNGESSNPLFILSNDTINHTGIEEGAKLWAVKYGYKTTTNINEISTGTKFYEVDLNNLYIGDQKVKTNGKSSHPLFILSNDTIVHDGIVHDVMPVKKDETPHKKGGRKRKSRKTRRKTRKTRRKSSIWN
jgi:hypothetical protein